MTRVGILISGRGSNMVSLVRAMLDGELTAEAALVVSNRSDAAGLAKAHELGIDTAVIEPKRRSGTPRREAHDREIAAALDRAGVEIVCLAGYMRILSAWFVRRYEGRLINIHPSLLPAFPGLNAQRQALEGGARVSGCTVHFVDAEVDHGPIIAHATVPVLSSDDEASLSERILKEEHRLYPAALKMLCEGRVRLAAGHTIIDGARTVSRDAS